MQPEVNANNILIFILEEYIKKLSLSVKELLENIMIIR